MTVLALPANRRTPRTGDDRGRSRFQWSAPHQKKRVRASSVTFGSKGRIDAAVAIVMAVPPNSPTPANRSPDVELVEAHSSVQASNRTQTTTRKTGSSIRERDDVLGRGGDNAEDRLAVLVEQGTYGPRDRA